MHVQFTIYVYRSSVCSTSSLPHPLSLYLPLCVCECVSLSLPLSLVYCKSPLISVHQSRVVFSVERDFWGNEFITQSSSMDLIYVYKICTYLQCIYWLYVVCSFGISMTHILCVVYRLYTNIYIPIV